MMNPHRGEVAITLNGETLPMRLTLGALASLEHDLGEDSLLALIERFEQGHFRTDDIVRLLYAGLTGAGWDGAQTDLLAANIEGGPMAAAKAAGRLLKLSFGPVE